MRFQPSLALVQRAPAPIQFTVGLLVSEGYRLADQTRPCLHGGVMHVRLVLRNADRCSVAVFFRVASAVGEGSCALSAHDLAALTDA